MSNPSTYKPSKDPLKAKDVYDIDDDLLYLKTKEQGGDYWKTTEKFWSEVKEKPYADLTDKQKKWLHKIETALNAEVLR